MKLICLSGVARSGKDTICKMLIDNFAEKGVKAKRFALADKLKQELSGFLREQFNVDVFTVDGERKEVVRPILVAHGGARRKESNGQYWTSLLDKEMSEDKETQVAIVTDCRYTDLGEDDEIGWVKKKGGTLVHISRIMPDGSTLPAPNSDEERNDPIIKALADVRLCFGSIVTDAAEMDKAKEAVENLVSSLMTSWKN